MNPFLNHGETVAPDRRKAKSVKQMEYTPTPVEARLQERDRLSKRYRRARRQEVREILASEPRLRDFLRYLKTVGPETGGELVDALDACDWLRASPQPVRLFALRMIDARCDRINRSLGNEALDDPMPPDLSIYFKCRDILHYGGRA